MYCLRYFLLLLLMPTTGASPHFLAVMLLLLFVLHRPCVYCSLILIALFSSTCYFADHCFIDTNHGNLFLPRVFLPADLASKPSAVFDALAEHAAINALARPLLRKSINATATLFNVSVNASAVVQAVREFKLPCVAVKVRL
ncbi:hypothetical protein BZA70DRAFT_54326 [Myxozyma melibiosi]|uniref:Bladder cancer-related BC10-like protein n=1 Tax=Myxozyma melibiosi TaxID=54550 RepID=A0ABR1FFC9_9ASCO